MKGLDTNFFGPGVEAMPIHHEESMTFNVDGGWVNLPSVVGGKKLSPKEIMKMYRQGQLQSLDGMVHKDMQSAVNHARERSAAYPEEE